MNYGAFTNDSITTMYEVVRGALDADDTLKARGEEIRFRVRETAEWKKHAADLEMEMIKRRMIFEVIDWSQGQAELPLWDGRNGFTMSSRRCPINSPSQLRLPPPICWVRPVRYRSSPRHWTSSGLYASERHRQGRKSCT
jgi:hypothetical protein